jgi:hypothetical protein
MNQIILFFIRSEGLFYFFGSIIVIIAAVNLIKARAQWKLAIFSLEQEIVKHKTGIAITWLVLAIIFMVSEFSFVMFANVKYPNVQLPTPTISLLPTPTLGILGGSGLQLSGEQNALSPAIISSEGCTSGTIEWISPKPGTEVREQVELVGTVNVPNLGYYKLVYRLANSISWQTISGTNKPVFEDILGADWNIADLTPGDYDLGLIVMDNQENAYPECIITIKVVAP